MPVYTPRFSRAVSVSAAAVAAFAAAAPLLLPARAVRAQTYLYTGGGNGAWSEGKGWEGGKPPVSGAGTRLLFSGKRTDPAVVNDLGAFTLNRMSFASDAGEFAVSGDPLSFVAYAGAGPFLTNDSAFLSTLTNDLSLLADTAVGGAGGLRLTGALAGGGALSKTGAGTLHLSGPKAVSEVRALYVDSGALVIDSGSQVSALPGGQSRITGSLTIDGAGSAFSGYTYEVTGTISVTNGGLLSTGFSSGDPTGYALDFTQGGGSLSVTGQGSRWVNELTDVNLFNPDYEKVSLTISDGGAATIGGRLRVERGSTVTVDGGTLAVSSLRDGGPTVTADSFIAISDAPGGGSALILQGRGNDEALFGFNGLIKDAAGGPGSVTVAAGVWRLNTPTNTYSGGTRLNGGYLYVNGLETLGTGGLFFDGGAIVIGGDADFGADRPVTFGSKGGTLGSPGRTLSINQDLAVNGPLTIEGGTVKLTGVNTFAAPIDIAVGTLALVSDVDQTIDVAVGSNLLNGSLYKGGTGTLTLTQASGGFGQSVTVDGGALRLRHGDALYKSELRLNKNDALILDFADSAPLRVSKLSGNGNLALGAHGLILTGDSDGETTYGGSISGTGGVTINTDTRLTGTSTYTGGTTIGDSALVTVRADSLTGNIRGEFGTLLFDQPTDGTFAGRIDGDLVVEKAGAGTLRLLDADLRRYRVYAGTLETRLGNTIQIHDGATFRTRSGGELFWIETQDGVATIDTNGFDVAAQALYHASGNPGSSFVKTGAGTLTVLGIASAASLDLREGSLELGRSDAFYEGVPAMRMNPSLTVGGGTELRGSALLVRGVTLNSGGTISPGRGSVSREAGTFLGTSLVWDEGGVLRFDLNADGTGDLITLSSAFTKGATGTGGYFFDFSGSLLTDGTRYTLVGLGGGATTNFTASDFRYRGLSGGYGCAFEMDAGGLYFRAAVSDVSAPEPSALGLLLAASPLAVAAAGCHRRRRGRGPLTRSGPRP